MVGHDVYPDPALACKVFRECHWRYSVWRISESTKRHSFWSVKAPSTWTLLTDRPTVERGIH